MKLTVNEATMRLQADQLLKLKGARGSRVFCHEGLVWLTQEGMTRDDFLSSGASMEIATQGLVLIEALGDSTLTLASGKVAGRLPQRRLSAAWARRGPVYDWGTRYNS